MRVYKKILLFVVPFLLPKAKANLFKEKYFLEDFTVCKNKFGLTILF